MIGIGARQSQAEFKVYGQTDTDLVAAAEKILARFSAARWEFTINARAEQSVTGAVLVWIGEVLATGAP